RLDFFEDDILRFTTDKDIPFSNNDAERPVRLFKLHFKVSGCFRSEENIENFCQLWSYTESCKKNGIKPLDAIRMLQNGELPQVRAGCTVKDSEKSSLNSRYHTICL
ncbi:MAG: transposase, partial [Lactobacillales bacterium]|nr:transposase [Lactobacillales bacterium]